MAGLWSVMIAVFLAALLLRAALHKARHFAETTGIVASYRLVPAGWEAAVTRVLVGLEVLLVGALFFVPGLAALVTAGLFLVYAGAMVAVLRQGRKWVDCGCGGPPQFLSRLTVGRNVVLAGIALLLTLLPGGNTLAGVVLAAFAGLTAWAIYMMSEQLLANSGHILASRTWA